MILLACTTNMTKIDMLRCTNMHERNAYKCIQTNITTINVYNYFDPPPFF